MLRLKDLREDHELTQAQCAKIGYIAGLTNVQKPYPREK